jgi:predicted TIM-barrel fold metal-dependent hydrolase
MVPGPVPTGPDTAVSPASERFDGFWARISEAGIPVAYHSGDAGYRGISEMWGGDREFRAFDFDPVYQCLSATPIHDTFAGLLCGGVFDRHPGVRVASIECGSDWAEGLVRKLKKAYGQMPSKFASDPVDQLRRHVFIAPYYEDDIARLRDLVGASQILFGSDFPHAEGLAEPTRFVEDIQGFPEKEIRQIMSDNGRGLIAAH